MRSLILGLISLTVIGGAARAQRPEILVVGTYHMNNPGHDIYNMQADDVLAPKRQQEIAELLQVLAKFKPTKIGIESNYGTDVRPKQYADYLAGTHELSRNEIEQLGFRLAKQLGHTAIYPVDADGEFPWPRVLDYAKAKEQPGILDTVQATWSRSAKELSEFLSTHSVLETLLYLNSDARVAQGVATYFLLARYGEPYDYAGPDLLAEWYRRNVRIYNNVMKLATSPEERILVIFGSGHLGWLRPMFAADPTVRLRKLEEFAPIR